MIAILTVFCGLKGLVTILSQNVAMRHAAS